MTELAADNISQTLLREMLEGKPEDAGSTLVHQPTEQAQALFSRIPPSRMRVILEALPPAHEQTLLSLATAAQRRQWAQNTEYPEDAVGRLMEVPVGVFPPEMTVDKAVDQLEELIQNAFISYLFVVDEDEKLRGVVAMRELLFGGREQTLGDVMLQNPFFLTDDMPTMDAMREVLDRHFPVYPVCDDAGRLVGIIRGQDLFEAQAVEISAQAGAMVGVQKEERAATPWLGSLKMRHPWLQLNLVTAFLAAAVVAVFQDTIDRVVVLAAFLPVLAGQSGNTGCQALAVTLRGMTLGEVNSGVVTKLLAKEAWLGFLNGSLVGVTAAIGMGYYGYSQGREDFMILGAIVFVAMIAACVVSGVAGAAIPLVLKRLGADPATASSIFLTTATDVASMGLFLGLATAFIPA